MYLINMIFKILKITEEGFKIYRVANCMCSIYSNKFDIITRYYFIIYYRKKIIIIIMYLAKQLILAYCNK